LRLSLRSLRIDDPPEQVTCPAIEVPKDQSNFRLVCEAAAGAQPGDFEVHLVSSAANPGHTDKRECTVPPVAAHMVVAGDKVVQTAEKKT